jgi:outer membrane translocation and assembly module TamA
VPLSFIVICKAQPYILGMRARSFLPVLPLTMVCISSAFAQLPKRVEKCLPYPTLAQEIRDMQPTSSRMSVSVSRVEFGAMDDLPEDAKQEIVAKLRTQIFHPATGPAYIDDLTREIVEVPVMAAFQNRGYFKAQPAVHIEILNNQDSLITVSVTINVAPGPQYRIGDIRVESEDGGALQFAPAVLRAVIPLQVGDLFSVENIRTGLDNLSRAYAREGYIDMTAEPVMDIDDAHHTIDMVIKIDQQTQYRVGTIGLHGVTTAARMKLLQSLPRPGEIFDRTRLDNFIQSNRPLLPPDVSTEDISVRRDLKSKTVAISFELSNCLPDGIAP